MVDSSNIDFDKISESELQQIAVQNTTKVIQDNRNRAHQFTSNLPIQQQPIDLQAQSVSNNVLHVSQPEMLTVKLKPYQLKGLNWLANLYEQGINGILADDMYLFLITSTHLNRGLGKTIQTISLLGWLAETQNIWGPFLVIAPASTLHNWEQEISKFTPRFKALPYWGSVKDRKILRYQILMSKLYF